MADGKIPPIRTLTLDQAKREANAQFVPSRTNKGNLVLMLGTAMVTLQGGLTFADLRANPGAYQLCVFEDSTKAEGISRCITNGGGIERLADEEAF